MSEEKIDYGPLAALIGVWEGNKGMDVAPDPEGREENPYYETITFEGVGYTKNAEKQCLAALRYLQVVRRKSDDQVFHDQTGYWMWDKEAGRVMQSLSIPRAVCLLAVGEASEEENTTVLHVKSDIKDGAYGVVQSSFMHENAKTLSYEARFTVRDTELRYEETTMVDIYSNIFEHTDTNLLARVQ